ncbi:MAG: cytochrome c oxidase subunit [Pseudonocardiales bacterium]|jgi:cytochrome c oxidase subunit 2|nr:cytochrome c oxidase subunit [Pseudonocardiales bacterium]
MTTSAEFGVRARRWSRRPETRGIFLLWTALTVVLVAFAFVPSHIMGPPASPTMRAVEDTMTVFSIAAAPVAAIVWAIVLYSLLKWRHRGEGPPPEDGPAIRSNGPVTTLWLVVSSVLCMFLLVWGLAEMQAVANPASSAPSPLVVNVTGQQWVWTFSYPQNGNVESDQLFLPKDRVVVFHVTSKDVIHSFWIVQLGVKVDANPGETTDTRVVPDRLGVFDIRCAELCGLLHADMETSAHVVSSADFSSWVTTQAGHS